MRKVLFSLLCISILFFSCNNKSDIRIRGMIDGANGRTIRLAVLGTEGLTTIDSAVVKNGKFEFCVSKKQNEEIFPSEESVFFNLSFSEDNSMTTLVGVGESVDLTLTNPDRIVAGYKVTGAPDAVLMGQLDSALSVFANRTDTLLYIYRICQDNDSIRANIEGQYNELAEEHHQYLRSFIQQHPQSLSSVIAFYRVYNHRRFLNERGDADVFKLLIDSLSAKYPQSQYVEYLKKRQ